mmetsp:Transcript_26298/g.77750  ORF Transcript_26298/g.77750 Transcript_26298/m.77750 type:complete len:255 (-) Transcript_26298:1423-2187(-)
MHIVCAHLSQDCLLHSHFFIGRFSALFKHRQHQSLPLTSTRFHPLPPCPFKHMLLSTPSSFFGVEKRIEFALTMPSALKSWCDEMPKVHCLRSMPLMLSAPLSSEDTVDIHSNATADIECINEGWRRYPSVSAIPYRTLVSFRIFSVSSLSDRSTLISSTTRNGLEPENSSPSGHSEQDRDGKLFADSSSASSSSSSFSFLLLDNLFHPVRMPKMTRDEIQAATTQGKRFPPSAWRSTNWNSFGFTTRGMILLC